MQQHLCHLERRADGKRGGGFQCLMEGIRTGIVLFSPKHRADYPQGACRRMAMAMGPRRRLRKDLGRKPLPVWWKGLRSEAPHCLPYTNLSGSKEDIGMTLDPRRRLRKGCKGCPIHACWQGLGYFTVLIFIFLMTQNENDHFM